MRLTLPARYWDAIDRERRDRDGQYIHSWIDLFLASHYGRPVVWPTLAWLWANGEGRRGQGMLEPPGGSMVGRHADIARRRDHVRWVQGTPLPVEPYTTAYLLLRDRATHEGRPMAEVFRRLVRDHFDSPRTGQAFTASPPGYPNGYLHRPCSQCDPKITLLNG